MYPIEEMLYTDPQRCLAVRSCPDCGSQVYPPGYHCVRCGREKP